MEYKRSEIGAGVFLLVSFVVLAVMVFAVSDIQSLFRKKKELKALFLFSDGIEQNAQVRLSGIKIGDVTSIRVAPESGDKVELTLRIYDDVVVKSDAKAAIKTLGLVGGKYVDLTGGTAGGRPLEPGETLTGEESFKLEDLTRAGLEAVEKLKNVANNLDSILGDRKTAASVKAIVKNLQDTSANLKVMTSSKDEVAAGLKTVPDIMKKIPDILDTIPDLLKKLEETTAELKSITEKTDALIGENRKKIDETLDNVEQMTRSMKDTAADVKKAPWKLLRKP